MAQQPKPRPMPPALLAVIARVVAKVSTPQHREVVARAERQRRRDIAAMLEARGK